MKSVLNRFICEETGQDLIEYGLLLGIITVGSILLISAIGTKIVNIYTAADTALGTASGAGS